MQGLSPRQAAGVRAGASHRPRALPAGSGQDLRAEGLSGARKWVGVSATYTGGNTGACSAPGRGLLCTHASPVLTRANHGMGPVRKDPGTSTALLKAELDPKGRIGGRKQTDKSPALSLWGWGL